MRPPNLFQILIGNPVVSLGLMLGAIFVIWLWFTGSVDGWTTIGAIIIASTAAKAAEGYNAYSAWKREWERSGNARAPMGLPGLPSFRVILAIGSWALLAGLALDGANGDPVLAVAIGLFWLVTTIVVAAGLYRLFCVKARAVKNAPVAVCIRLLGRSENADKAHHALPKALRHLLS